jgi:3-phenylpropionate/trans-cinnamate dioxygenase ferredoxin reductase subunit
MLGNPSPHTALPWFWSDQYDLSLQITGLPAANGTTVRRDLENDAFILFHYDTDNRLTGASGIGTGNAVARDIRLTEMLIAKGISPPESLMADAAVSLKKLLKA